MEFKLTQELAQGLLDYLARKPYVEVAGLISGLQKLEKIEEEIVEKS